MKNIFTSLTMGIFATSSILFAQPAKASERCFTTNYHGSQGAIERVGCDILTDEINQYQTEFMVSFDNFTLHGSQLRVDMVNYTLRNDGIAIIEPMFGDTLTGTWIIERLSSGREVYIISAEVRGRVAYRDSFYTSEVKQNCFLC